MPRHEQFDSTRSPARDFDAKNGRAVDFWYGGLICEDDEEGRSSLFSPYDHNKDGDDSVFLVRNNKRRPWWYRRSIYSLGEPRSGAVDWSYGGPIYDEDEEDESV